MSRLLTWDDGVIRLGGQTLPGILISLRIDGQVRFDEAKIDGSSGTRKTPQGYEDCAVSLSLALTTDADAACYDRLAALNAMFRGVDRHANPQVLDVANRHLLARGIRQVVFSRLESAETEDSDVVLATLSFVEHNPPIVRVEQAESRTPTPAEAAGQAAAAPEEDVIIVDAS